MTLHRATITADLVAMHAAGEDRHPGVVVRLLAHQHGFTITESLEEHPGRSWAFEVEGKVPDGLPRYLSTRPHR